MLLRHRLDQRQTLKDLRLEVAVPVHLAGDGGGVAVAAFLRDGVVGGVFAGEDAAGEGVVNYDVDAVFAAAGDQLGFDGSGWMSYS